MVDDYFYFKNHTSVFQCFYGSLAVVYRFGQDVGGFVGGYFKTDLLGFASGVLVTPTKSSKNVFGSKNVFFIKGSRDNTSNEWILSRARFCNIRPLFLTPNTNQRLRYSFNR